MARSFLALLVVVVVVMLTAQTQAFSGMIVLFVCFFFLSTQLYTCKMDLLSHMDASYLLF